MPQTAFLPSFRISYPTFASRRVHQIPKCALPRVAVPSLSSPRPSAQVSILTDFSSNPLQAVSDRASDPLSAAMIFAAALFGAILASLSMLKYSLPPVKEKIDAELAYNVRYLSERRLRSTPPGQVGGATPGESALWLNMSLRTLWRLFRRSTNGLVQEVLQPVLDEMEFPEFVSSVTIRNLTLGESPALVRKIERLPSRSLNEIQYRFKTRLVGDRDGKIDLDVKIKLPGLPGRISIPVTVSSLDIDAKVWLGLTVVPYAPWIRFAQWSLVKLPHIRLKVNIAQVIPMNAIPVLSPILNRILTEDLPQEFVFPKTQFIDLMDEENTNVDVEDTILMARGIQLDTRDLSDEELKERFPGFVALFQTLDLNADGRLDTRDVSDGLIQWGFASEADRNSIVNLLDVNNDGYVDIREFISIWADLRNLFVPQQYRGVLNGILLKAEGLRTPTFGPTDPYVEFQVETQSTISKKNKATSKVGNGKGFAVWNEGWELFVRQPKTAVLNIIVREGAYFSYYKDYIPPIPLPQAHSGTGTSISPVRQANRLDKIIGIGSLPLSNLGPRAQTLWVDLTNGGGRVRLDVQFNEFVDPRSS